MTTLTARHPQRPSAAGEASAPCAGRRRSVAVASPLSDAPSLARRRSRRLTGSRWPDGNGTRASSHRLADRQGRHRLLARLDDDRRVSQAAFDRLKQAAAEQGTIPPAGAWLVDNFNRLRELIRSARRDSPQSAAPRAASSGRHQRRMSASRLWHSDGPDRPPQCATRPGEPAAFHQRLPERDAVEAGGTLVGLRHVAAGVDRPPQPHGEEAGSRELGTGSQIPGFRLSAPRSLPERGGR